jgi:hypothetical protein
MNMKDYCEANPIKTYLLVFLTILVIFTFGLSFENPQYKVIFFMLLPLVLPLFWSAYPKFLE